MARPTDRGGRDDASTSTVDFFSRDPHPRRRTDLSSEAIHRPLTTVSPSLSLVSLSLLAHARRYEDNADAVNNLIVTINPTQKSKITDFGGQEAFLNEVSYLLGNQALAEGFESKSEGKRLCTLIVPHCAREPRLSVFSLGSH